MLNLMFTLLGATVVLICIKSSLGLITSILVLAILTLWLMGIIE